MKCRQIYKLYDHQAKTVDVCDKRDFFALLYDTGTGKTPTTIAILREKFAQRGEFFKVLIICPLSILQQWHGEWVKFGGEMYRDKVSIVTGTAKQKKEALKVDVPIYITNIDTVNSKAMFECLMKHKFECVVVDESHQIKGVNSKRTKNVTKLGEKAKYKFILTGTPQTNGIHDLWSQYNFLCPGVVFHENFFVFRGTYFYDKNAGARHRMGPKYFPNYVICPGALEEIMAKIYTVSHVIRKEDCLDLPELVDIVRHVEMTPEQKRLYKDMERDCLAELGDKQSVAAMAMTKGMRLQQLNSGIFKDDEGEITMIENNRSKVLQEILESINPDAKIIIWSVFIATYKDIEKVCEKIGRKCVSLTGQQSNAEKQRSITEFRTSRDSNTLIANPKSGGTGLNLTEASYSIYYTRNFNLEEALQSRARNYRAGSSDLHKKITMIHLTIPESIDEVISKSLREKEDLHDLLMDYKKAKQCE